MNLFLLSVSSFQVLGKGIGWEMENEPVNSCLPSRIVETVEDIQEHHSHVSGGLPIGRLVIWMDLNINVGTGVLLLISISTTPNNERKGEKDSQSSLCSHGTSHSLDIQSITPDNSSQNLSHVVKERVESFGAGVEASTVDGVELIGVEPVGGPEHGEEKENEGLKFYSLVESDKFGLPAGVLHEDDSGSVGSDNVVGVAEHEGEDSAEEHEHDEGDVSSICHSAVGLDVDVLAKRDLVKY